jgi:hypothetical protein
MAFSFPSPVVNQVDVLHLVANEFDGIELAMVPVYP